MKIYEKVVIDIESGKILDEASYDYNGPIAQLQTTTTTTTAAPTTTSTTTFTTTTPPGNAYGICVDQSFGGYMTNISKPTWSEARDSTSAVNLSTFPADPSARIIVARHYFSKFDRYTCARFFVRFDLSEFPVGVSITDIRIGLPVPSGKPSMEGKFVVQEGPTSFTAEEWNGYTGPDLGHSVLPTSNVDGYNYVYLNSAGKTFVENNIGGYAYFCLREYTYDYPDVEPLLGIYEDVWSNTSDPPYVNLEIYYEPATLPCTWLSNYEYVITDRGKPGTVHDLRSVAYGDGRYVAVGLGGKIITSTDGGEGWVQLSGFTSEDLFVVRYLNCVWYAGGRNVIGTSPDGLSWSWRVNPANGSGRLVRGFAYDGQGLVVAASWSHTIEETSSYSTDNGQTWIALPNGSPDMFNFEDLIYAEGIFVGCGGSSAGSARFTYSYDGLNWSAASIWAADNQVSGLAHNGSRFFAVGTPGRAWISDDGVSWTRTSQEEGPPRMDDEDDCEDVLWNGCQFVIAAHETNSSDDQKIITTLDGYQPFTYEYNQGGVKGLTGIAFDGISRHVCVGYEGQIITADIQTLGTTTTTVTTTLPPAPTTTTCQPGLTDDDFNDGVIAPWWTLQDERGGEFVESGGYMNIYAGPDGCDAINPCTPSYIAQCIDPQDPYDYWINALVPTLTRNGQEYGMMSRDLANAAIYAKVGVKREGGIIYVYALYSGIASLNEQTIDLPLGIPEVWFRMVRDSNGFFWFYYALSQPHSKADWTLFDSVSGTFDQDGRQRVGLFATSPLLVATTTTTTITTTTSTVSTTTPLIPSTTTVTYATTTTTFTNFGLWQSNCTGTPGYLGGLEVSQSLTIDPGVWQFDTIEIGDMISTSGYAKVTVYYGIDDSEEPTSGSVIGDTIVRPISIGLEPYTFSFNFPRPIVTQPGPYMLVVTATDSGGNIAYGETVTLYASSQHYAGGLMWYYDEGGPGWVQDSSSDALCIMLRGVLVYTPVAPSSCPSCPDRYYIRLTEVCTADNYAPECPSLNQTWILERYGVDRCWWRYDDGEYVASLRLSQIFTSGPPVYYWAISVRGIYACRIGGVRWESMYKEGQSCPPSGGYPTWRRTIIGPPSPGYQACYCPDYCGSIYVYT